MARLVVLQFNNNDDAEQFIGELESAAEFAEGVLKEKAEVRGLFALPTVFCPGQGGCGRGRIKAFFRGPKYGWWVCARCGKPSAQTTGEKLLRQVLSQGRNLLPGADRPAEVATTFDEGWGAYGR